MKFMSYKIVIAAVLIGCGGQTSPIRRDDPPKAAEPREFQGSYIVDCEIIHQQRLQGRIESCKPSEN
jgi:hypothetical protein